MHATFLCDRPPNGSIGAIKAFPMKPFPGLFLEPL